MSKEQTKRITIQGEPFIADIFDKEVLIVFTRKELTALIKHLKGGKK